MADNPIRFEQEDPAMLARRRTRGPWVYVFYRSTPTTQYTPADALGVIRWCEEHFGAARLRMSDDIIERWYYSNQGIELICLRLTDDAFAFKMRWC